MAIEQPAATGTEAPPAPIDVSPEGLFRTVNNWIDGFFSLVPNLIVAVVLIGFFYILGLGAKTAVIRWADSRARDNLGDVLGGFIKAALIVTGFLFAMTVVLPSVKPGDLVAGLGIGSVAIGFAFKDILQNWLAGMLILIRQPFRPGDQIVVDGFEGTVDHVETRVTAIKTYDGRMALIPNSDVYTNAVVVNTAFEKRRSQYDVGIGYADDIARAREVILAAIGEVEGVEADPAPEVLVSDLAASWVTLRPRWWTDSKRTDVVHVKSRIVEAIKIALDDAGIDMPFETVVQLYHDQTDEHDGTRGKQREGWPSGDGSNAPRSLYEVERGDGKSA